jgi:hypothetical protein
MKKLYICITACLLSLNYSYSQSKDDFKLMKTLVSFEWYPNPTKKEKLMIKYQNNPVIRLTNIFENPLNSNISVIRTDFKDSLSRIKNIIKQLNERNKEILNLKVTLEGRKDSKFEKESKKDYYTYFEEKINDVYIDNFEFRNIFRKIHSGLRSNRKYFSYTIDLNPGFIKKTGFGSELSKEIERREFNKFVDSFWKEYNFNPIIIDDIFEIDESILYNVQNFINAKYRHYLLLKDGVRSDKFEYYGVYEEDESTVENTINEILQLLKPNKSNFYISQYNNIETYEVVKILKLKGYESPYLDLLNMNYKLHKLLKIKYKENPKYIFDNVFNYSHEYKLDTSSNSSWNFYKLEEPYSEKDINTMKLISEYLKDSPEVEESRDSSLFVKSMIEHNSEFKNPTPKNCKSDVHKNTILKTQLYSNNGQRKLFSVIYQFDLKKSFDREDCVYIWEVVYNDLFGNAQRDMFRSTSDFSGKDNRIKIELWDWKKNEYYSPVYVKPIN